MNTHFISIFIPHKGCPHDCVFCNQKRISGTVSAPSESDVRKIIEEHISTNNGRLLGIAFFGGSFTGIPLEEQEQYLKIVNEYRKNNMITIKASTRPDCINEKVIKLLVKYGVEMIELGVQSMDDRVLRLSGRGHSADDVVKASEMLRKAGISVGIQTMTGLPGDTVDGAVRTAKEVISLSPDVVRIYPTLVIRDTALYDMYISGSYNPVSLEESVSLCALLMDMYENAGIKIIRAGLQPTDNIRMYEDNGDVAAGPFHPAFRQLAQSERIYREIKYFIKNGVCCSERLKIYYDYESRIIKVKSDYFSTSDILGQKSSNVRKIKEEFGYDLKILSIN